VVSDRRCSALRSFGLRWSIAACSAPRSPPPPPRVPPRPVPRRRRHPDERQDPGLRAARCLALDPDFRQMTGWGVGRGWLPSSGAWLCAASVCAGQSLPAPRRAPPPPPPACSKPRHRRHPDGSQDPGLRALRCLALGPDFRQDDGLGVGVGVPCPALLGPARLGSSRLGLAQPGSPPPPAPPLSGTRTARRWGGIIP